MAKLLLGKPVADAVCDEIRAEVRQLLDGGRRPPGLAAVLVGGDPASLLYVNAKGRRAKELGFLSRTVQLTDDSPLDEVLGLIDSLNADADIDGILVQLPLPEHLPTDSILERIHPTKDVDGFHPLNVGRLWLGQLEQTGQAEFVSATPAGILQLLHHYEISLAGKHAVIVGRSNIVGKPLAALLLREHCTVTLAHSRTRDLASQCRQADLLVTAIGRAGHFGADFVQRGAVLVDVGINRISDPEQVERLYPGDAQRLAQLGERGYVVTGDVDFVQVEPRASAMTPVPGGVGPLTVAMVLRNTLKARTLRATLRARENSGSP